MKNRDAYELAWSLLRYDKLLENWADVSPQAKAEAGPPSPQWFLEELPALPVGMAFVSLLYREEVREPLYDCPFLFNGQWGRIGRYLAQWHIKHGGNNGTR